MSFVAKIEARAYSRATEVPERVVTAILNLYPEQVHDLVEFESSKVEGHSGDMIQIFVCELSHRTSCEATLNHLLERMESKDHRRLSNSLIQRIDENCIFFVRIDKQEAFLDRVVLAKGPDVISVQMHIRNYPRCRQEDAIALLEDRLRSAGGDD